MQLRTKIILAFSAMLLLVVVLGTTGYLSTENMNNYAVQSSYIEQGKSAIEETQTAYLRYVQSGDPQQADQVLTLVNTAEQAFHSALPYMISPERKSQVEACARNVAALEQDVAALVKQQSEVRAMFGRTDDLFLKAAELYNVLEAGVAQMARDYVPDMNQLGYSGGENEIMDNLLGLFEIRLGINRVRTAVAQLSINSSRQALDEVHATLAELMDLLKDRHGKLRVTANRQTMETVIANVKAYRQSVRQYTDLLAATGQTQEELNTRLDAVKTQAQELSDLATASVQKANDTADMAIPMVCGLALLLGVFITFFLSSNVTRQLGKDPGELARIADRVAGGDFNVDDGSRATGVYSNIIKMVAMLKANIDEAREQSALAVEESSKAQEATRAAQAAGREAEARRDGILAAAERLEVVVNVVSEASQSLSAQIEQSGHGADEQAARVTETATAMEEMNSTVLEVARNAGKASEFSAGTRQKAEAGAQVVQNAVDSIQAVKTQSEALRRDMDKLAENAQAITRIMNVISDIADQTNLLALNAAIEAARAGEAGRGFAVVADEVRNLAEKTMASTSDVANAIRAIQESVSQSAQQLDAAVDAINEATELSSQSGQALVEIVAMADGTADQVRSIATASEEQSATSEEITRTISQVNEISTQTAEAMRSAASSVAELARQAQDLTGLVAEMRKS